MTIHNYYHQRGVTLSSLWFFFFLFVLPALSPAQFNQPPVSPRSAALGGVEVALSEGDAALHAVAPLAFQRGIIAISYRHDYLLEGMAYKYIAAAHPVTATGSALAAYTHYGSAHYSEQHLRAGYAQAVTSNMALGATIDYLYAGTDNAYYSPRRGLTFSLSAHIALRRNITLGAKVFNPIAVPLSANDYRIPAILSVGGAYRLDAQWLIVGEVQKNLYQPLSLRGGVEYSFLSHFALRAGISNEPFMMHFGVGYSNTHYSLDMTVMVHPTLGAVPLVGGNVVF